MTMDTTRRQFLKYLCGVAGSSLVTTRGAGAISLHCTPAPTFPVPLTAGVWHSAEFPVGKHDYHVTLYLGRDKQFKNLDCALGPTSHSEKCSEPPLLDLEWNIKDHGMLVKTWSQNPIEASSWSVDEIGCMLGGFEGKRNGMFTLEWNVKKDGGWLKEVHPRVEIVKNPGYWCWL